MIGRPRQSQNLLYLPDSKANSQSSPQKAVEASSLNRSHYRDAIGNSSSGSQSRFFYKDHSLGHDAANINDSNNTSGHNLSVNNQQINIPQPIVSFDITDHDILRKEDYVVYHLNVITKAISWNVPLRYSSFKDLNDKLVKNYLYKDKVPPFPPKRLKRKSKEVIEERKKLLSEYMNILSTNINIFRDEIVIGFLNRDCNSLQMQNLADMQEKFLQDLNDFSSFNNSSRKVKKSAKSSFKMQTLKELQGLQADQTTNMLAGLKLNIQTRKRGLSYETDLFVEGAFSPLNKQINSWNLRKFENLEEKLNSWLEEMQKNRNNQSQLIQDFQDYYFCEKPMIPIDYLKRLFYGYLKNQGILDHLQECHKDRLSFKTKSVMNLMIKLLDHNKCHQIEEITSIWKTVKPDYIKECHFEFMINDQQSIKEAVLTLLKVYLDDKVFKVTDLIKDEKFAQKFYVWQTNKNRQQNSFSSNSSVSANSYIRKQQNSFACSDKPHFGVCNHLCSSGISMNNQNCSDNGGSSTHQKSVSSSILNDYCHKSNSSKRKMEGLNSDFVEPFRISHIPEVDKCQRMGKDQIFNHHFQNLDHQSSSGSFEDSESIMFLNKTQQEAKQKKGISVQVNVPRHIIGSTNHDQSVDSLAQIKMKQLDKRQSKNYKIEIDFESPISDDAESEKPQFDLSQEIQKLIKLYDRRSNLIYRTPQIEDLESHKVLGQVNQYIFDQNKYNTAYKLKLTNFRRLLEGMRPQFQQLGGGIQSKVISPPVQQFFSDLNCEIVKEIDDSHKLIRYSFKRKVSLDFDNYMKTSQLPQLKDQKGQSDINEEHLMLVSYQTTGPNNDIASISLFEFNEQQSSIDTSNFIIISQSIGKAAESGAAKISFSSANSSQNTQKSKRLQTQITKSNNSLINLISQNEDDNSQPEQPTHEEQNSNNFGMYRTLSAVTEDYDGEELGSISIKTPSVLNQQGRSSVKKSQQLAQQKQSMLLLTKFGRSMDKDSSDRDNEKEEMTIKENDSVLQNDEDDFDEQDKFLFENNFASHDKEVDPFDALCYEEEDLRVQYNEQPGQSSSSAKASLSTTKSSNAEQSVHLQWTMQHVNDNIQSTQHKYNKFDEVLSRTQGDVSVIMRISDDQILLNKILSLFKGLANQINLSLHGIR